MLAVGFESMPASGHYFDVYGNHIKILHFLTGRWVAALLNTLFSHKHEESDTQCHPVKSDYCVRVCTNVVK